MADKHINLIILYYMLTRTCHNAFYFQVKMWRTVGAAGHYEDQVMALHLNRKRYVKVIKHGRLFSLVLDPSCSLWISS